MPQFQFSAVLQSRVQSWTEIRDGKGLAPKIVNLLFTIVVSLSAYGLVIGASHGWQQAISSALKLPSLYLLTGCVCLPTLVVFCSLMGSRQSLAQHFTVLLSAIAAIGLLQLGFLPVTLFFLVTSKSYVFFKILNVLLFTISGWVGVKFFSQGMRSVLVEKDGQVAAWTGKLLTGWGVLFAVVGTQLGWTLRPFFGSPDEPFEWVREMSGNFYVDILRTLGTLW